RGRAGGIVRVGLVTIAVAGRVVAVTVTSRVVAIARRVVAIAVAGRIVPVSVAVLHPRVRLALAASLAEIGVAAVVVGTGGHEREDEDGSKAAAHGRHSSTGHRCGGAPSRFSAPRSSLITRIAKRST